MAKLRADDELCIDRLYLCTILFLNYTLRFSSVLFFFFFFCCAGLDHLSTGANNRYSVRILLFL